MRLLLACSGGGHLKEGINALSMFHYTELGVFTYQTPGVEKTVKARWFFTVNPSRNPVKYVKVLLDSVRTLKAFNPDIVVSTGAGMTLPILALARAQGIKTVFIESAAQVVNPSLSARLAYTFVDEFYYQWSSLRKFFPRGKRIKPLFRFRPMEKEKNLVFVTVGTHPMPFDRLLRMVDEIASDFPEYTFVFQIGHSNYIPKHGEWFRFTDAERIEALYREARWIVAHAGVGTIMNALEHGVRPFVVPRLKKYGEHTNDHQIEIVRILSENGLVLTGGLEELKAYLKTAPGEQK